MKIDLTLLKKLRQMTFVGYDFCKKALIKNNNNFEKAVEWLHQQGIVKGARRMHNKTSEGICKVFLGTNNDALLLELNCETDFVADNKNFQTFFQKLTDLIFSHKVKNLEAVLNLNLENTNVEKTLLQMSHKFGEKIVIGNLLFFQKKPEQHFAFYNHNDFAHSALLVIDGTNNLPETDLEILAMHVVAMKPQFISWEDISQDILVQEKKLVTNLIKEKLKNFPNISEAKKAQMIDKKIKKNLEPLCLLKQKFVKEPNLTVGQYLQNHNLKVVKMFYLKVGTKMYEC